WPRHGPKCGCRYLGGEICDLRRIECGGIFQSSSFLVVAKIAKRHGPSLCRYYCHRACPARSSDSGVVLGCIGSRHTLLIENPMQEEFHFGFPILTFLTFWPLLGALGLWTIHDRDLMRKA